MKTRIVLILVSGVMVVIGFAISAVPLDPKQAILITLAAILSGFVFLSFWKENARYKEMAYRDHLTGLFNRREFDRFLAEAVERVQKKNDFPVSLIMVDVDHFKGFNDRFGHQTGDFVLQQVAKILIAGIHLTDIVCRYGGEEIAIVLYGIGKDSAAEIAERLCRAVADSMLGVTISLGVATLNIDANNAEGMVKAADEALYRAKANGRNRVCCAKKETVT